MLHLSELTKVYGSQRAVDGVSLEIREGEFFSLLGPSGCGKTTLLRMLGGFESPSAGRILMDGRRVDLLPPHQRDFNMVFQRYALFPHLNVHENVAFGLRMKKVPSREIAGRVQEALALVRMESFGARAVATLSGGQQQRVALARAVVNQPRVLLLDEPLSALDLKLREEMQAELRAIQRRLKMTFVLVTHDQEEALTLSDRIAVMRAGKVEQVGAPREIYERPRTEFVAGFIGSVNSFPGKITETRGDSLMVACEEGLSLSVGAQDRLAPGTEVRVMVRPERIRLLKAGAEPGANLFHGKVKEVIYQGPSTRIQVQVQVQAQAQAGNGTLLTAVQSSFSAGAREGFSVGEDVLASWAPEDCVVLRRGGAEESRDTVHAN